LKRHLANHGLTPAEYRGRYKLAKDYPMVAPAYSEHRRAVAQAVGLGQRRAKAPIEQPKEGVQAVSEPVGEAPAAASAPKTKSARASKPRQLKPASQPAPSTGAGDADATPAAASAVLAPKRRGRPPASEAMLVENSTGSAAPKKRGRKPAQAAPVDSPSASPPRAKPQSVKTDTIAAPSAPARKGRRKAKAA
jgi:hypothetical protein